MKTIPRYGAGSDPGLPKVVVARPGQKVIQRPRTSAIYEIDPRIWGHLPDGWTPTISNFRPAREEGSLHVAKTRIKTGSWLRHNDPRSRVSATQLGPCLTISGGLAGAEYEIRISPKASFFVRVSTRGKLL